MNAKLAKKLRKISKFIAHQNAEQTGETYYGRDYVENERNRKRVTRPVIENGELVLENAQVKMETFDVSLGTISLTKTSVRGLYQGMKRAIKTGNGIPGKAVPLDQVQTTWPTKEEVENFDVDWSTMNPA